MNTSIAALKRSKSNLDNLVSELNKVAEPQKQKQSYSDDRFWKPELDNPSVELKNDDRGPLDLTKLIEEKDREIARLTEKLCQCES